jgi:hypothetical protein
MLLRTPRRYNQSRFPVKDSPAGSFKESVTKLLRWVNIRGITVVAYYPFHLLANW